MAKRQPVVAGKTSRPALSAFIDGRPEYWWHDGINTAKLAELFWSYGFNGSPNSRWISRMLSLFRDSPAEEIVEKQCHPYGPDLLQFIDGLQVIGIHDELLRWLKAGKLQLVDEVDFETYRLLGLEQDLSINAHSHINWGVAARRRDEHPIFRHLHSILDMRERLDEGEFQHWDSIAELAVAYCPEASHLNALLAVLREPKKRPGDPNPRQQNQMIEMKKLVLLEGLSVTKASQKVADGYEPKNAQRLATRFKNKMKLRDSNRPPIDVLDKREKR